MRRLAAQLMRLAALVLVLLAGGVPAAMAAPATPSIPGAGLSSSALPAGFPAELRRYVAGTKEFAAAPWSTGACADQGGDVGAYINAIEPVESRLMYWVMPASGRTALWAFLLNFDHVKNPGGNLATKEPPLPATWPGDDADPAYRFPSTCAYQLRHWAPAAGTTFGFLWSPEVDPTTIAARTQAGDRGFGQAAAIANRACWDRGSVYCAKAYFVDCSTTVGRDLNLCSAWNKVAVNVQVGLHRWVDAHTSTMAKVGRVLGNVGAVLSSSGKFAATAFSQIAHAIGKVIDFVLHPGAELDRLANRLKSGAISLMQTVFSGYNQVSTWEVSRGNFLHRYAMVAALGWTLLAVMFFGAVKRAHDAGDREALAGLLRRLVGAGAVMAYAPLFASLLVTTASKLTDSIIDHFTAVSAGTLLAKMAFVGAVTSAIPGGVLIGVVLFGLMFLGAIGLFFGLMIERFGMEIGTIMVALIAGLYVHPRWKIRVTRSCYTVIGLIFAKPLVILLVGVTLGIASDNLSPAGWRGGGFGVLAALTLVALSVLFCGIAPFALLRWAPVLPTDAGSHDRSSAGMLSGAVIGGAGSVLASAAASGRTHTICCGTTSDSDGGTGGSGPGPLRSAYEAAQLGGAAAAGRTPQADSGGPAASPSGGSNGAFGRAAAAGSGAAGSGAAGSGAVADHASKGAAGAGNGGAGAGGGGRAGGGGGAGAAAVGSAAASIGQAAAAKARHTAQRQAPDVDDPAESS